MRSLLIGLASLLLIGSLAQADTLKPELRRVVTKLDERGKAVVMFDQVLPVKPTGRSPNPAVDIWATAESPPALSWTEDRAKIIKGISPPQHGTIIRVVDFVPTSPETERLPMDTMMKAVGDHAPPKGLPPRHPMMHRTRSIDYAIILSGEIDMLLDEGEVHFKAGDILVQQATNHAWVNRGKEPCRIAFILIDSQEP